MGGKDHDKSSGQYPAGGLCVFADRGAGGRAAFLPAGACALLQLGAHRVRRSVLFYVLCVLALVFFPLPDAAQAAKLSTYRIQLVPFQFVADFLRETPLVFSDARTYLPALLDRTVLQVVCNILMLMPFGMYLRYVCGLDVGRVALASLAFSAFIELGQLTGLFFVFRGSYRLCDVDDLMLNTLGGLLGGELVRALEAYLPPLDAFDRFPGSSALAMQRLG